MSKLPKILAITSTIFALGFLIGYTINGELNGYIVNAHGETYGQKFGIALSSTCIRAIQSQSPTNCPKIDDILLLNIDSSNRKISGDFVYKNGYLQRETPQLFHHFNWYAWADRQAIFVDPSYDIRTKIQMITIEASLDKYQLETKAPDNTRTLYSKRYVDPKCNSAVISATYWKELLADTIHYLRSNCTQTNIQNKEVIATELTEHDITTSQKWKDDKRLEWIKKNCLTQYGVCKSV